MMIRNHEKPLAWRAGVLTLTVHSLLIMLLLLSFQWHSVQPMQIASVELWDQLPTPAAPEAPPPAVEPEVQKPLPEKPIVSEPVPEKVTPAPVEKVDIAIKPQEPKAKPLPRPVPKPEPKPEPVPEKNKASEKNTSEQALKQLQQSMMNEDTQQMKQEKPKVNLASEVKSNVAVAGSTIDNSEMAKYIGLITAQIKQHVNAQVCGSGKPELDFMIQLMPSGQLIGKPQLLNSSASNACNDAVERAILEAQPLQVPRGDLFNQFRSLKLKFKPNEV